MRLILYSKPGCHLCEGLLEKLEQIQSISFELEVRDITARDDWFQAFQYEVPVLFLEKGQILNSENQDTSVQSSKTASVSPIPRPSPRLTVQQLEQMLQKYFQIDNTK